MSAKGLRQARHGSRARVLWIGGLVGAIVGVIAAAPNFPFAGVQFFATVVVAIAVGAVLAGFFFQYFIGSLITPSDLGSRAAGGHTGPIAGRSIDSGFGSGGGDGGGDGGGGDG